MDDLPVPYRVVDRRRDTGDTCTVRLEPDGERRVPRFRPGQFAMLYAFGVGDAPISISGIDGDALVHTVRAVGAVTRALCAARPDDIVGVRGPFGTPWPLDLDGGDVVVAAGGLGLPPVRPLVHDLLARRERVGRLTLLYGARTPADLLFGAELDGWRTHREVDVAVTVDAPSDAWRGRVGFVTRLVDDARFDAATTTAYVCGPEPMMRRTAAALCDRGVAPEAVWLSLERSMACGVGHCGHCQLGPLFVCKDGPVVRRDVAEPLLAVGDL